MNKTDATYWDKSWEGFKIPAEYSPGRIHEQHRLFQKYLKKESLSFFEVGCAPGQWMAYFRRNFGYDISGIDYAPNAVGATKKNFELLNMPAEVLEGDFFNMDNRQFDVVFSGGFIEHFENTEEVVGNIVSHAKDNGGVVITIIPSVYGINGWISKTFRPDVYDKHVAISLSRLKKMHKEAGMKEIYSGYLGCCRPLFPMTKNNFSKKHPKLSKLINLPFNLLNGLTFVLTRSLGKYPQAGWFARSIIYIGQR